ncbi:oxygen-independent coproporphyrinogen-3 oxidase [Ereboglobus sp. PH5-5]|uniref:radical SAM family heme chaperone HemW n=1 Tax=Ereboglobus sp. PH5-5 TaxID=2940529 RepID=UPI002406B312|nr:radical SAM family heme chaperone HemW [Ereboglobus sp. PH5-5]MDF9831800.1 oxygen-independent coproporphyrinogen-3 oxidase [Ereboglobus sp. PH5-5]
MSEIDSLKNTDEPARPENRALGLYVHVPFCATRCDFCAFYEEAPSAEKVRRYLDGVAREVDILTENGGVETGAGKKTRAVDTVFWGGGTPGVLAAKDILRLGGIASRLWKGRGAPEEWSVELAPGSVSEARLEALREIGVTRVSLGVQSFRADLLEALGRRHSPSQIYRAYERIRAAGFKNVNLDMMFALPGQEEAAWLADVGEALALGPDHLSTYCLTFEEDTALWVKLSQGKVKLDAEREARLYERTWAELDAAGFPQYEISNFARRGFECVHNLNTWRMEEWIGLGPSAASQHAGWRGANARDLGKWLAGMRDGARVTEDRVRMTPALLAEDALIFGLRMNEGVDVGALRKKAGADALNWTAVDALVDRLTNDALAINDEGRLRLTLKGRLVADAIAAEMLGALTEGAGSE